LLPTLRQLRADIDCLAHIQTPWWALADLSGVIAKRDAAWIGARSRSVQHMASRFLAAWADDFPAATLAALQAVSSAYEAILQRSATMPLTVVHGDAHPWNFLSPRDFSDRPTYLLDWEGWSIEPGPHDLASLLALHLPSDLRPGLEVELLTRYVDKLRAHGVTHYDLQACRDDYRRSVARRVLSPVGMWSRGSEARTWMPMLERVIAAFDELRCEELL
jgi:thiamine kinase-like enzyme